jgi:hypothetical protein
VKADKGTQIFLMLICARVASHDEYDGSNSLRATACDSKQLSENSHTLKLKKLCLNQEIFFTQLKTCTCLKFTY